MSFTLLWSLIALLFLSSVPAYADWREVGSGVIEGGYTVYVDPATVRHKGDLVKIWILYDYKVEQTTRGKSYWSVRSQQQFDCAEERQRYLAYTFFSDKMGTGNVVKSGSDEGKWSPVAPESVAGNLWNIVCGTE
jgi:hypothetical protein